MHCPYFKKFEADMCVSSEISIIPSVRHTEQFCKTNNFWACPIKGNLAKMAEAFSYSA
jgi:hypothetical protein